jgi:excisionase family DNA binding protein
VSQSPRTALYTQQELADMLRISTRTVRRWARDGRIEEVRLGRLVRYTTGSVEALMRP